MNYGQRIIYDCANFVAHKNELTIIMGNQGVENQHFTK